MPPRYRPAMRFHCCPPEKKGALATPKKGGTVGRSSGAGKGLRGSKGKAKSKNPMADVECEDEIEEEIARAFAEAISLDGAGGNGETRKDGARGRSGKQEKED